MDVNGMEEVIGMMGRGVVEGVEAGGQTGAQGATGPRTEEGKAVASRNALKHGLTAARAENAVDPELKAQYEALRRQYLDDFRAGGGD